MRTLNLNRKGVACYAPTFTAVALALATTVTLSCSSDDGDDNGFTTGANGSIINTRSYDRIADCEENRICLLEEDEWYRCQEDGTLKTEKDTYHEIIDYSIANNVLSLSWYGDEAIKFNGSSNQLEGTWTRTKGACEERTEEYCIERDDNWDCLEYETKTYIDCGEGYNITKAVFTQTSATFTHEYCDADRTRKSESYRGWNIKAIDCNTFEYSKGNQKMTVKSMFSSNSETTKVTYNGKTCTSTRTEPFPSSGHSDT